ncbi:malate synthase G [Rhodobacteraceae bacterium KMM 6894]|nr:malate synthase G [Rhodobacteraceae bacterium KMM 6894]
MTTYVKRADIDVSADLADLIENKILLDIEPAAFWQGYSDLLKDLIPENRALLAKRETLQAQIDDWHRANRARDFDVDAYSAFLREIGYLLPEPKPFQIDVTNVDPEIAIVAGPQLVVPVMNARFALNAANARWGSLYDALYGTDAIPGAATGKGYDPQRGAAVIVWARSHLDTVVPLADGSWKDVEALNAADVLTVTVNGKTTGLANPEHYAGYRASGDVMLRVNGLLIDIRIDRDSVIGATDPAGIADIRLESALTAIQDCEDSVAAVDAADKCTVYANWLGLMKGDLEETLEKGGKTITRRLHDDLTFTAPDGSSVTHAGRALMLVRNVGHLMTNKAILFNGQETPEGIMDAVITVACAMHDLAKTDGLRNSRAGSVYVVKPKMHGPEEVAFSNTLYSRVEDLLGLPRNTVKLGIMDEERRTSANLLACIAEVKSRCVFINTGFLDRTGDEIHTMMQAGPVIPRGEMASSGWIKAYENGNVDAGLAAGLMGQAQIGKGMWAKPDNMAEMLDAKIGHPKSGANTAWVPSPTAATLHATHYHRVNVADVQEQLKARHPAALDDLLTPPVMVGRNLSDDVVAREIDNACQSILGYVVRWVNQGVGCSKVPDIDDVALMEDRATLRISSQYLANWIQHGICTAEQVEQSFRRMASKVDAQNAGDAAYTAMAPAFDGEAFNAARDLVFKGVTQPSGYTEPLLYAARLRVKQATA